MAKNIDFDRGHSPISGTINAAYTALSVAAVGHETGLPASWSLGVAGVGAVGSAIAGASHEPKLSGGSIALRASAWLAGGGWVSWALTQPTVYDWHVVGPLLAAACGFGSAVGVLSSKKKREERRQLAAYSALFRVKTGQEWTDRISRVCHVENCQVIAVEQWTDEGGKKNDSGFTIEIQMPQGGATWRQLARMTDELASDANLPEGCGIEVFAGKSRGTAIMKVSTKNWLTATQNVPHDASPLSFEDDFDIGVLRDGGLATINIREFSAMLVGAKRTGKTNQLLTMITRFLRMPNLRVWVIDFNGGGVALQWLRAWDALGRPGRPPIDWVASNIRESAMMAEAAVRVAKARKVEYQQLMADADTDLLPMTADIPGILIITDEGAEIYANPKARPASDPMKEVLRIAGSSGVNQLNCFLRATADTTGDTIVKSQSRVRIGMMQSAEEEIGYLHGWKCGIKPEDMPDRGYAGVSQDENGSAQVMRGYRTLPSDIKWFVEHTVRYRENSAFDEVSTRALGGDYEGRWSDERSGYIFTGRTAPEGEPEMAGRQPEPTDQGDGEDDFFAKRGKANDPEQTKLNLRKAVEEGGGPSVDERAEFDRVIREAGVADWDNPATWAEGGNEEQPPAAPTEDESADDEGDTLRAVVFGLVKAMTPEGGISVGDIVKSLQRQYGKDTPRRETITRWLREDERIFKPTGYGKYAVRDEDM
jgi:hypothetical protein